MGYLDNTGLGHLILRLRAKIDENNEKFLTQETDPTVPDWAKTESKPTYSASEVGAVALSDKGVPNGVASLGEDGKVPGSQLNLDSASGKRASRITIGAATAGWAEKDCDYLCDGTADDVEINAAITALPDSGGEIVLLDGTYNLAATIQMNKAGITLSGNGAATKLVRGFSGSSTNKSIIYISKKNCVVRGLAVDGVKSSYYSGIYNHGIQSFVNGNTIEDCIIENVHGNGAYVYGDNHVVRNIRATGNGCGVYASGDNNIVSECACAKNDEGIYVSGDHNVVFGCVCTENDRGIELDGNRNIINGNVSRVSSEYNIYVDASSENVITDNDFSVEYGDGVKPTYAIRINDSYCIGNVVADNTLCDGVFFDSGNDTRVGGKIVTGTYTGTGASNRTITIGFKPRFVWVFCDQFYLYRYSHSSSSQTSNWWTKMGFGFLVDGSAQGSMYNLQTDGDSDCDYYAAYPVDDGFTLLHGDEAVASSVDIGTNVSGIAYSYFAIQ